MPEHFGPPSGTAPKTGDGLVRVTLNFVRDDGLDAKNVFGVDTNAAGPVSGASLGTIADDIGAFWETGTGGHAPSAQTGNRWSLAMIEAKDLTAVDGEIVERVSGVRGTDIGGDLAAGQTFAVTLRTVLSGRSHRGRCFLVGLTDNFLASGSKDVADIGAVNDYLAAFTGLIASNPGGGSNKLSVFSYSNNNAYRANIAATPIVSAGTFDLNMDYQRRRAPGHNRHF